MAKASIHVQAVKATSERHNKREMDLDYVRKDLSYKNESWETEAISSRFEKIRERYEKNVGQRMQEKAAPIKEAVFNMKPETTFADCKELAKAIEDRFGIRTFQIHLHRDEGHYDDENEWKPNLHGHLVLDWTNEGTGKSIRLTKQNMSELQTITANVLGMERGENSDRKHLTALQYKNKVLEERQKRIQAELIDLRDLHKQARAEIGKLIKSFKISLQRVQEAKGENEKKLRYLLTAQGEETKKGIDYWLKNFHKKAEEIIKSSKESELKSAPKKGGPTI